MDREAGWWTTSGNIGLPPLARAMGVGRQQQDVTCYLLTCGCSATSNWKPGPHAVSTIVKYLQIDDVLQITIKFTLEADNRTRGNTAYILGHCIKKAYCSPSITIIGK